MKGQTSVEWLFIAAIVLTVSVLVLSDYSREADRTIAETTLRNQADLSLSRLAFDYPNCTNAKLVNITRYSGGYVVYLTECAEFMDGAPISAKIAETLGCRHNAEGICKGKVYNVEFQ